MAVEKKRGCGYRKVGKLYLVGDWEAMPCDRLPYKFETCPVCGAGIKQCRGWTKINPFKLMGNHNPLACKCDTFCFMCLPPDTDLKPEHYGCGILWVGSKFYQTPEDFCNEAQSQGISKAIPQLPKWFVVGKSIIYMAHPKACETKKQREDSFDGVCDVKYEAGLFLVWKPQRLEKLFWESQRESKKVKEFEEIGGTPVFVPDGDKDHARNNSGKRTKENLEPMQKKNEEETNKKCNICHGSDVHTYWQVITQAEIDLCDECADAILKDNPKAIESIEVKDIKS